MAGAEGYKSGVSTLACLQSQPSNMILLYWSHADKEQAGLW